MKTYFTFFIMAIFTVSLTAQTGFYKETRNEDLQEYGTYNLQNDPPDLYPYEEKFKWNDFQFQHQLITKYKLDSIDWYDAKDNYLQSRYKYYYDDSGVLDYRESDSYANGSIWISGRYEYSYDDMGRLEQYLYYRKDEFSGEQLRLIGKYEYLYDGLQLTERYYSNWNSETGEWSQFQRYEYTYDSNDRLSEIITSSWDSENEQWYHSKKAAYGYNDFGMLETVINSVVDFSIFDWRYNSKNVYLYDEAENLAESIRYQWDKDLEIWEEYYKYTINYDLGFVIDDMIYPFEVNSNNKIEDRLQFFWNDDLEDWILFAYSVYHYSEIDIVGTEETTKTDTHIFPNPTSDIIKISDKFKGEYSFSLFGLNGSRVLSKQGERENRIDISHLEKGMYFYRLISKNSIYTGKLMIE